MNIIMLGTGNALVKKCYNTCFAINHNNEYFLVDGGGGNQILSQLEDAKISIYDLHHIFVTHKHLDHIIGIIWLIRMILQGIGAGVGVNMGVNVETNDTEKYYIYGHDEVIKIVEDLSRTLIRQKEVNLIGEKLFFVPVKDGEEKNIIGQNFKFFDIHSDKAKQFGFSMNNKKLVCCGDEPYNETIKEYIQNADWLMHEAFCLDSEADIFNPYEKKHSTVKDACTIAQKLDVKNLILYHTEDKNIEKRKNLYSDEGKKFFNGNLYVPNDLETINID